MKTFHAALFLCSTIFLIELVNCFPEPHPEPNALASPVVGNKVKKYCLTSVQDATSYTALCVQLAHKVVEKAYNKCMKAVYAACWVRHPMAQEKRPKCWDWLSSNICPIVDEHKNAIESGKPETSIDDWSYDDDDYEDDDDDLDDDDDNSL